MNRLNATGAQELSSPWLCLVTAPFGQERQQYQRSKQRYQVTVDRARRLGRWFWHWIPLLVILGFRGDAHDPACASSTNWARRVVGLALGLRQLTQQGLGSGGPSPTSSGRPLIVCGMLLRALGLPAWPMPRADWN